MDSTTPYGYQVILDLHNCDPKLFNREDIRRFMKLLCKEIGMTRARLFFWGYDTQAEREAAPEHLAGISAVQFITTSNITIHTLDKLGAVNLDVFSCKEFDPQTVIDFCRDWFKGTVAQSISFKRF